MMCPSKTQIIVGPPGTGKTTTLMNEVEKLIDEGYSPEEICFVSFTKKAAKEASDRACFKFQLDPIQLPWFRTLHSLAFVQGGFKAQDMMGIHDYIKLGKLLGLTVTAQKIDDGTIVGQTKGDRIFFAIGLARVLGISIKEWHTKHRQDDIALYELERVIKTLARYKEKYGKVDFHDIIDHFIKIKAVPDIKVLIIDEAQDLQPLQWKMADILAEKVDKVYVAGDDDQAIFRWAGADVEKFISLEGDRRVLDKSYRTPASVNRLANNIAGMIKNRIPKQWEPREEEGEITCMKNISMLDMSKGSWLLLGRNAFVLEEYIEHCRRNGWLFTSRYYSPVDEKVLNAIRVWENIRKGATLPIGDCKCFYQYLAPYKGVASGFKGRVKEADDSILVNMKSLKEDWGLKTEKIWHEALTQIKDNQRLYLVEALRKGEKVTRPARISVQTIHGVKGGEADNVVLCPDMARRTYNEFEKNRDDEYRVWYVAVTRAREKLFLIDPTKNTSFNLRLFLNKQS